MSSKNSRSLALVFVVLIEKALQVFVLDKQSPPYPPQSFEAEILINCVTHNNQLSHPKLVSELL
ncbi:hypothetical protein KC19_VG187400 [Ceratodon purpureus]|uniref:Uncharacterized protein n=1 Tax=Ceratodon purpureus TaxID=3225 RepID=A0A8T0HS03_CERPU|nr:hypothetical protein KC19_VG187400 [Ceratodon purpureus]